ncbi:MAG: HAD-IA family hydrolase [Candidatus Micrarchaeota archaeon]
MGKIKLILFDLDDTLHSFKSSSSKAMGRVYELIEAKHHVEKQLLVQKYGELLSQAEETAFFDGRSSREYRTERFSNLLEGVGIKDEGFVKILVDGYGKILEENTKPFPETMDVLKELKKNYSLGIITEGPLDAQKRALNILGIEEYFGYLFVSGDVRKIKRTGELFLYALEEIGVSPNEALLIGDSYKRDVVGGCLAGLRVILVNREKKTQEFGEHKPVATIDSLKGIKGAIREIGGKTDLQAKKKSKKHPFMILGHSRSGTNFISSIIVSHPDTNVIIEPFSQHTGMVKNTDCQFWTAKDYSKVGYHAQISKNKELVQYASELKAWLHSKKEGVRIFKETTFLLQLQWLKKYLPDLRIIYVERNPLEIFASFKKSDFYNRWEYDFRFNILGESIRNNKELAGYRKIFDEVDKNSNIEKLSLMWKIKTEVAKNDLEAFVHEKFKYNGIVADPEKEFGRMFRFMSLKPTPDTIGELQERMTCDRGSEYSAYRASHAQKNKWKEILTKDEVARAKKILDKPVPKVDANAKKIRIPK